MTTLLLARGELYNWLRRSQVKPKSLPNTILNFVIGLLLMTIAIFIFVKIGLEVRSYSGVFEGLLSFYLFIFFALVALVSASGLRHSLFDSRMSKMPLIWPVNKAQIILSKTLVSLVKSLAFSFVLSYPVWIAFGIVRGSPWYLYFLALLYPLLISVAEVATGFLLCVPMEGIRVLLRKSMAAQIVFGIACALILSFVYGEILQVFVKVIVNGDLNGVLEIYSLSLNGGSGGYLYPSAFLVILLTAGKWANLGYFVAMVLGILGIGSLIAWPTYFRMLARGKAEESKVNFRIPKTPAGALIYKEFSLMFRGRNGVSGLLTLVVGLPFVSYFIVTSMNYVFSIGNLRFVPVFFPMFTAGFTGMMILMTAACVCTSSMDTIKSEGPRLCLMKLSPLSMEEQLAYKGIVPLGLSAISFICSMVVLGASSLVDWTDFSWILIEGLAFLFASTFFDLISQAKAGAKGKSSETLFESLIPFIVPVIIYGIVIGISAPLPRLENYSYTVTRNIMHAAVTFIFIAMAIGATVFTFKKGPAYIEAQARKEEE